MCESESVKVQNCESESVIVQNCESVKVKASILQMFEFLQNWQGNLQQVLYSDRLVIESEEAKV